MCDSIQFIFDLEEQGRLFHFDDDPAEVVNFFTGAPIFARGIAVLKFLLQAVLAAFFIGAPLFYYFIWVMKP